MSDISREQALKELDEKVKQLCEIYYEDGRKIGLFSSEECEDAVSKKAILEMLVDIDNAICDGDGFQYQEWHTKVDELPSVLPKADVPENNVGKIELTTKNDLGVDAVSRKAVHDMLENLPITVEDKWFNWLQKACMRLAELPSVTPQEPRWILVSEKLPEESTAVLVWCPERKNIYCACYEEKQWWIYGPCWNKVTGEIVAWRPLPISPNSEVGE